MFSRFRHVFAVLFFLVVASCSGGGCSGCGGCAGTAPLAGGFPKESAIDNAASVRLSKPGLDFLESNLPDVVAKVANLPGGKLTQAIPEVSFGPQTIFDYGLGTIDLTGKICPGGPDPSATPPKCVAEANLGASTFQIDAVTPNAVVLSVTLPFQLDDTAVTADLNPGPAITVHLGVGSNGQCTGTASDKVSVQPKALPIKVTIPIVEETTAPRQGYAKIDVDKASVDLSGLVGSDVQICANCGPLTFDLGLTKINLCNTVLNLGFLKNLLVDQLKGQLAPQIKSLLQSQLCTKPNPALNPPCPDGSKVSGDRCVYVSDASKCVPMFLGTEAHADLSGALASISPGTTGGLDFVFAAGGSMKPFPNVTGAPPTPNGITLALVGGVTPKPQSNCVPEATLPLPTGIPLPDELAPATAEAAGTPHVGIALAGRFLDYAFASVYNSGLLCLGVSTEQVDMLKSGLLSILIPSIKNLTFEQGDAAAAIATRPQAPPSVKIGGGTDIKTDPLLTVSLPKFAIDFYIWSQDRFVRAFTFQGDLTIPVNLQTSKDPSANPKGGLSPTVGDIKVSNGVVDNAGLLMDDPALIASALSGLLGGLSKQLVGGGISPIDLSSALSSVGLDLKVDQIKKLSKGSDDFIGIFATMAKASGAATVEADTSARLVSKSVPADKMQLATIDADVRPELVIEASTPLDDGTRAVEYSWWIDRGTRAPWSPGKRLVIRDDQLLLQGRHVLHVAARLAGEPLTEDATPADVPFTIDALAPSVKVEAAGDVAKIDAWDVVSAKTSLVARFRLGSNAFGDFRPLAELASVAVGDAESIEVEVKDEEGNVRRVRQELIRGRADGSLSAGGSGCGCSTPGGGHAGTDGKLALALALAGLAYLVLRRRAGASPRTGGVRHAALAVGAIGLVASTTQGCGCGSESEQGPPGCGPDCAQECKPALSYGMPGSYTSVAKAKDGAIWIAGYNDALLEEGDALLFGDLVVGRYDLGKQAVEWKTVDGAPQRTDGSCAERPRDSWRNGESDSGDNVGLWTSLQIGADGKPLVSYYDATNKRLKLAFEDGGWNSFVLREQAGADVGRYSKMILDGDKPVVAFLQFEPGADGKTRSKVVLARSTVSAPRDAAAFTFEDVAVEEDNPCRPDMCAAGQQCLKSQGVCAATTGGCTPADCGASSACVTLGGKATCAAVAGAITTYPNVFGGYVSLAAGPSGLGIAVYDRVRGNVVGLAQNGGSWKRFIIDGETGSRADKTAIDTGDVGVATSLVIDPSGKWHLTYVNGLDESLRYISVSDGKPGNVEIVDDGTSVGGVAHADGRHLVGDDSTLRVDGDLVVVYYQDATTGTLRRAAGTFNGTTHKWDLRQLPQPGKFAGFFPAIVPGEDKVANWWRQTDKGAKTVVGDVTIVTP